MSYSIGEVSDKTGLPISTLHYYDREGFFPYMERGNGGTRVFSDAEISTIEIVECLKKTGMPIKDIKQFLEWCKEGDNSIEKRRAMFYERRKIVEQQIEELQQTLNTINFKCWYYDTAAENGTESVPANMPLDEMPENIRQLKCASSCN